MARAHWVGAAAGAAVTVVAACLAGAAGGPGEADGIPRSAGRYQIAAQGGDHNGHIWMLDTATGRLWSMQTDVRVDWNEVDSPVAPKR
jgi:hypothetical protein